MQLRILIGLLAQASAQESLGLVLVQFNADAVLRLQDAELAATKPTHVRIDKPSKKQLSSTMYGAGNRWTPTQGSGGKMLATRTHTCSDDTYQPSQLEHGFATHALDWTADKNTLCGHLDGRHTWIHENLEGNLQSKDSIFSTVCLKGQPAKLIEPLAGILRDPRMLCDGQSANLRLNIDWLVLADQGSVKQSAKKIMFDAGGTRFMDAMNFFTTQYEKRGIKFDHIYVWEAVKQSTDAYWAGVPADVRDKWKPRLTFYNGIPCSSNPKDDVHNPVTRLAKECGEDDFCVFKLDIDTPEVELPLVQQLMDSKGSHAVLDEFFFEHHVHGLMQRHGWGAKVQGTFADSYAIFSDLRKKGVRAHSWI